MNIYNKYQTKDVTDNPFEQNFNEEPLITNTKKKREISKIDFAEDSKEIKGRLIFFYKNLFKELFRIPEDITGWTRYLTLFIVFLFFLYPHPMICFAAFLLAEPIFVYKALYCKNPTWTVVGWGVQIFQIILYMSKCLPDKNDTFMNIITGGSIGILNVMYFICIIYCLRYEKKLEIINQIKKAENDQIRDLARKASEEEFNKNLKDKYFERDYTRNSNFYQNTNTNGISEIGENIKQINNNSDLKYFNGSFVKASAEDPDSLELPDISSLPDANK